MITITLTVTVYLIQGNLSTNHELTKQTNSCCLTLAMINTKIMIIER